jgi:enoyl-CoA hydratase/carnithine racemase
MELTVVEYEKHDHIAHVKLNRPDKLNAMNDAMHQELGLVWKDFRKDKDLRVGQTGITANQLFRMRNTCGTYF